MFNSWYRYFVEFFKTPNILFVSIKFSFVATNPIYWDSNNDHCTIVCFHVLRNYSKYPCNSRFFKWVVSNIFIPRLISPHSRLCALYTQQGFLLPCSFQQRNNLQQKFISIHSLVPNRNTLSFLLLLPLPEKQHSM